MSRMGEALVFDLPRLGCTGRQDVCGPGLGVGVTDKVMSVFETSLLSLGSLYGTAAVFAKRCAPVSCLRLKDDGDEWGLQ